MCTAPNPPVHPLAPTFQLHSQSVVSARCCTPRWRKTASVWQRCKRLVGQAARRGWWGQRGGPRAGAWGNGRGANRERCNCALPRPSTTVRSSPPSSTLSCPLPLPQQVANVADLHSERNLRGLLARALAQHCSGKYAVVQGAQTAQFSLKGNVAIDASIYEARRMDQRWEMR